MRQIFLQSADKYRQEQVGSNLHVLWEKATPSEDGKWQLSGLSDNYLRVRCISSSLCRNQIMNVHITRAEPDGLAGEISTDSRSIVD